MNKLLKYQLELPLDIIIEESSLESNNKKLHHISILAQIMKRATNSISNSGMLTNDTFTSEQTNFDAASSVTAIVQMMSKKADKIGQSVTFRFIEDQNKEIHWTSAIP